MAGHEAIRTRKDNPYSGWGSRRSENRIEPITKPGFAVPFTLTPGERIFTIGSCFARNVETELVAQGFSLPMRDLFTTPEFFGLDINIVNNFGTPSIYNEIAWAFGGEQFDEATGFCEVRPGLFVDTHMTNGIRPAPIEAVRARRQGLLQATRLIAECRVLIMTLGLVELWWDARAGKYLNTAPFSSLVEREPGRFFLHVLSHDECHDFLRRAFDIVFAQQPEMRIILTVSPVPLMITHRDQDVVVANCYSKSVQRAVVEQMVTADPRICYFPSYESVTTSHRTFAWMDDFTHVTREIVAVNVTRMIDAFTNRAAVDPVVVPSKMEDEGETLEALAMVNAAQNARAAGDASFFSANSDWSLRSPSFALEHARFLQSAGQAAAALAVLEGDTRSEAVVLRCGLLLATGQPEKAYDTIDPICIKSLKGTDQWPLLLQASAAMGDPARVIDSERRWMTARPHSEARVRLRTARHLAALGETAAALERYRAIENDLSGYLPYILEAASAFKADGDEERAQRLMAQATPTTAAQRAQLDRLRRAIG